MLGGAGVVGEPIRELGEVEERRQIPWRSCRRVAACCGVACVEQREGAVVWMWRSTLATLSIFAGNLSMLSMSGKLMMSVAIDAQMSSRDGHPHPVRGSSGGRLEDSAFHSSANLMVFELLMSTSVICRAIPVPSTGASIILAVMCSSG